MAENKVLARVMNHDITEADVDALLAQMGQRAMQYDNPQGREILLNQLINQRLLLAEAVSQMYEREKEFKEEMARIKEEMLVNYTVKKAVESVRITEEEIRAFFDEHPEMFAPQVKMNADHILVPEEEQALSILAAINAGEIDFADAAREHSTCPSKANGGNLGDFTNGQMVPEFDAACMSMEVGSISAVPVRTQFGYHIIRLNSRDSGEPVEFEAIKDKLGEQLLNEKQQKAFQSKLNQLMILHPVERF